MISVLDPPELQSIDLPQAARPARSRGRVAYLLSRYPAVSHSFLLNEVLQLRRLGFEVDTASINPPDRAVSSLSEVELKESNKTYYVKSSSRAAAAGIILRTLVLRPIVFFRGLIAALQLDGWNVRATLYSLFYFAEALLVGDWMRRRGVRHLHVHFCTAVATVAYLTSIAWDVPFSLSVHGPDEFHDMEKFHVARKIARASFVLCISDFCRSQLMRVSSPEHWKKLNVVRLGVDTAIFSPDRKTHGDTDALQIICVGRLVPAKGQLLLLRAFADLLAQGYRLHLTFVGDGDARKQLEVESASQNLTSAVTMTGALNHRETRQVLEGTDLFVLPSFAEGLPVALMEAMAMEIPCVSTFIAGIPELIRDGVDGRLVPASSCESLYAAMKHLIDDPQLRRRLGIAGRQRVLELHDLTTNSRLLANVLERNLGEAG
jgi:colanic acid/amylovoran biosynthesis glycosyltransferase